MKLSKLVPKVQTEDSVPKCGELNSQFKRAMHAKGGKGNLGANRINCLLDVQLIFHMPLNLHSNLNCIGLQLSLRLPQNEYLMWKVKFTIFSCITWSLHKDTETTYFTALYHAQTSFLLTLMLTKYTDNKLTEFCNNVNFDYHILQMCCSSNK